MRFLAARARVVVGAAAAGARAQPRVPAVGGARPLVRVEAREGAHRRQVDALLLGAEDDLEHAILDLDLDCERRADGGAVAAARGEVEVRRAAMQDV